MYRLFSTASLALLFAGVSCAAEPIASSPATHFVMARQNWRTWFSVLAKHRSTAELQGVITDWNCTEDMVRYGREKVLKQRRSCSLAHDYRRAVYGLITDDKKYYEIDPQDTERVVQILSNSPNKDNLKVLISGDLQGNKITIATISIL